MTLTTIFCALAVATAASAQVTADPPPVNEEALATRLLEMTRPSSGERAVILYDPTYYPGITNRLRDELHRRGVQTVLLVEDSVAMIASYADDARAHDAREREVVATLTPLFERSDIFYWMPARGYVDDLRWEFLVEKTGVRSVHFHWLLPFPGRRTDKEILEGSRDREHRALDVDLAAHARLQEELAAALRGHTIRITTPGGTDLTVKVPANQWFHLGNGDASKERAGRARSIRDREVELPVGIFNFVPSPAGVQGTIVPTSIERGGEVTGATLTLARGRVAGVTAASGADELRAVMKRIGPDGNLIGTIWIDTNPFARANVTIDIGSNWENGGRNRARRTDRVILRLPDATIEAGGRVVVEAGSLRVPYVAISHSRRLSLSICHRVFRGTTETQRHGDLLFKEIPKSSVSPFLSGEASWQATWGWLSLVRGRRGSAWPRAPRGGRHRR